MKVLCSWVNLDEEERSKDSLEGYTINYKGHSWSKDLALTSELALTSLSWPCFFPT